MGNKENNIKKPGFKTLSIHHGETFAEETGCVMPPIFSTSTFKHGNKDNFDYTRSGNPNFRILENILKSIEDSKYCTVFGSGISAVTAISSTLKSGDKILCESNLYGCTVRMFEKVFKKFGLEVLYTDFTNENNIKKISGNNSLRFIFASLFFNESQRQHPCLTKINIFIHLVRHRVTSTGS
jgi:cystathionine gamma-synthase